MGNVSNINKYLQKRKEKERIKKKQRRKPRQFWIKLMIIL